MVTTVKMQCGELYDCSAVATVKIQCGQTDVPVEAECIEPTSRENSEASKQNFEDAPTTQDQDNIQDQDIGQEQIQERMEMENEINIYKLYIKKSCKHGFRDNNCNYPHPAPCKIIY